MRFDDFRSTILTVDNLNGATILKRPIHVDHCIPNKKGKKDNNKHK
ncbi:hypothetical protein A3Q56_01419 [Intoshia linei]|uniref:RRM domain-containing protein n=1 Tax=Intoshia linei TaxID=1819745 RepID=A0A177B952_9BILA|nr:hypothetical protein A3Q56_01419 [Intoshia linei]